MRHSRAFTLIEVMIAVAVIGILAAIALPSYSQYMQRTHRSEGAAALTEYNSKMAHYYLDNNNYGAVGKCSATIPFPVTKYMTFDCDVVTTQTYTAKATGTGDIATTTFTIDQADARVTTAFPGRSAAAACWLIAGSEC